jgi:hypothetical protein
MLESVSQIFMQGFTYGQKHGSFCNNNPYPPRSFSFYEWEEGFRRGCAKKEWL